MATVDPQEILEHKVVMRVRDGESHRRVSEALTEVAIAAIHPARHLGLGRSECRGMLDELIVRATQSALDTLITHLEDLVETLPRQIIDQLTNEQVVADHGIE